MDIQRPSIYSQCTANHNHKRDLAWSGCPFLSLSRCHPLLSNDCTSILIMLMLSRVAIWRQMSEFVLPKDFETGEGKNDIRDGPGPGMEELDIFSITWAD